MCCARNRCRAGSRTCSGWWRSRRHLPRWSVLALAGLVLFALSSALEIGLTWTWTVAGRRMVYDLAEELFARLQRRSLPFHSRNPVGDSMSRITVDSWCVYQVIDALVFAPFHAAV